MNAFFWKAGLLLATLIPVILGLQTAAFWIVGNLSQQLPLPLSVKGAIKDRPVAAVIAEPPLLAAAVPGTVPTAEIRSLLSNNPRVAPPTVPAPAAAILMPPSTSEVTPVPPVIPRPASPPATTAVGSTTAPSIPAAVEATKPAAEAVQEPPETAPLAKEQPPAGVTPQAAVETTKPAVETVREPPKATVQEPPETAPLAKEQPPAGVTPQAAVEATKPAVETVRELPKTVQPAREQRPVSAPHPVVFQESIWLETRHPARFTIQLQSSDSLDKLKALASSYELPEPLAYYRVRRKGKSSYTLISGDYLEQEVASAVVAKLTAQVPALKPQVRSFGEIQEQAR